MPESVPEKDPINIMFAAKLMRLRNSLGLSRPKMATLLGVPPTTLKNYELNYRKAPVSLLITINQNEQLKQFSAYLLDMNSPVDSLPISKQ